MVDHRITISLSSLHPNLSREYYSNTRMREWPEAVLARFKLPHPPDTARRTGCAAKGMHMRAGMSRSLWMWLVLSCLALTGATAPASGRTPAPPADCSAPSGCSIFLPLIRVRPIEPLLNDPLNGAQIATVAPILIWTPTISSTYQVQVSADPS